jgi:glycine betaine catabolism B
MKLKLVDKQQLSQGVYSFVFDPEQPVQWQPGQYMHYFFEHPNADDRGTERWFTIAAPPNEKHIRITTRITEDKGSSFKKALTQMPIGGTINAEGPGGKFIIADPSKKVVLIAGGIGITPYYSMLEQMDQDGVAINADLLYANRDDNLVYGAELAALDQKHPGFHVIKFIGERHIEESDLKPYANDPDSIIFVSGPEPMVESFEETLKEKLHVPDDRLKTDFFPGYDPE